VAYKKNLDNEKDRTWREKGGPHHCPIPMPDVCPDCQGRGYTTSNAGLSEMCLTCEGTGEVWV